ncbi:LamG domain-containing protein, partial [archaeon]
MSKGVSLFISYALIILLAVSAVAIIMTVGLPTIKQSQESMSFNLAINNLQQLDSMIREVASEGQGSLRAVQISVNGGKYFMNAGKLIFSFEPSKSFIPNGTNLTRGGIRIEGGQVTRFTTGNDTQAVSLYLNQTNMSVYLHGGNGTVGYANYSINMTNGTLSNNTLTGYSFSGGNANYDVLLDSDNHTSVNNLLNISGITSPAVYYNASDGTWRNVSELGNIGYGTWNLAGTSLNYTLGGADGYEYGIRDALAGGSYWLDEKGNSLETGLVGYWKFGEVSGTTTNDSSGNANSGTLGNATGGAQPTWITNSSCKFGSCLNFDGIYSFVNISNSPSLSVTDALTISAWIRTNDAVNSNTERIVQKGGGTSMYDFFIQETNKLRTILTLDTGQANIFGNTALSANTWYHVVTTFSNATGLLKIYINGIEDVSTTVSGKITTNTNPLIIGAFRGLPTDLQKFNGIIDDVRIYNRALSADEIKRLYQSTSINLKSDFLSAKVEPYIQLNLTNSTDGTIFQKVTESILVDNNPITTNYPVNASMTYFFDWKENDWKVWQKNNYVDALAGYWKFDEGQGQWATDFSGKGNNGTLGNTSASEATYDPIWISNSSCK